MRVIKTATYLGLLFIALFSSCSEKEQIINEEEVKVLFSVDEFEGVENSRTSVDPSNKYAITWASGDAIGIFPREGYQEPFIIPTDQVGKSNAEFDGGYWALKDGLTYNAYYPFDKANFESAEMKTKIPVSYVGQEQNGTTCCVGAYDYLYSDWNVAKFGTVSFKFHHLGSLVVFSLPIPVTTSYSSLTVETSSAVIPVKGSYDLTATNPQFIADASSLSKTISTNLTNFTGTANSNATVYMMLPPVDLSSETLTLTLEATDGGSCVYSVPGLNIEKGKIVKYTGKPTSSSIAGTTHEWLVANGIIPEGDYFEVDVQTAGNLSQSIIKNGRDKLSVVDNFAQGLKISGDLNGTDIDYLRKSFANLKALDLSEANIVAGGNSYYSKNGTSYTTVDNEFPQYFMTGSELTNLESIILPNSVTKIGYSAFVDVFNDDVPKSVYTLNNIVLGEQLEEIDYITFACSITSIQIPRNVTKIGSAAFGYCPYLESINVVEDNINFKSIDGVVYENTNTWWDRETNPQYTALNVCPPAKRTFAFPKELNINRINTRAFSDCKYLTEIVIPDGVTGLVGSPFARCTALRSVTIPASVNLNYGNDTWWRNTAMEELHMKHETPPSWYFETGTDITDLPTKCKLHVPYTDGWKYSSTNRNNWSKYFSIQYVYE